MLVLVGAAPVLLIGEAFGRELWLGLVLAGVAVATVTTVFSAAADPGRG